jgi:hypothetical protein
MLAQTKDSIANLTTVAGAGIATMNVSTVLTMTLVCTGIVLNLIRIYEIRKKRKD